MRNLYEDINDAMNRVDLAVKKRSDHFQWMQARMPYCNTLVLMDMWGPMHACSNIVNVCIMDIKGIHWWIFPPRTQFWLPVGNVMIRLGG